MDEILKPLADFLVNNYPVLLFIVACLVVFLYILKEIKEIFFSVDSRDETFGTKLKYFLFFWLKKKKRIVEPKHVQYSNDAREAIVSKLLIHNFFQSINNMRIKIPLMQFGSDKKNKVFRDIIRIYIETIEKYAETVLKNYKLDELTTTKLNQILIEEIEKSRYEIYNKMRIRLGDALYLKLIDDPVRGIKAKNAIFMEIFISGVLLISSQAMSVYDYDNYERASEMLTSMYISLQVIVRNFESVFKDFNGEIDAYLN